MCGYWLLGHPFSLSPLHPFSMDLITALFMAAVPTAIYSLLLWWLDRYEKEPLALIVIAFIWGAIPAIALAVLFELIFSVPLDRSPLGPNVANFGLAPVIEELLKSLALVGLFLWARREFDGPLDGIVYGALIGFGFSMTENALYFVRFSDLNALFWVRGVLFGMNHALFTSVVGLALGAVRYRKDRRLRPLALAVGLTLAILLHMAHNVLVAGSRTMGLFASWMVQLGGVLVIVAVAVLSWRHEHRWLVEELGDEVRAGVISPGDYSDVVSTSHRLRRQIHALLTEGWTAFHQMRHLHHLLTELAFCKSKVRLSDRFHTCDDSNRIRREIIALRTSMEQRRGILSEY